jgi:glycosyltransferase involved in cell wall biosynthesis
MRSDPDRVGEQTDSVENPVSSLKVLIFTTDVHAGGIKASTLRLREMLADRVSNVSILSYEPAEEGGEADYSLGLPLVREFQANARWDYDLRRAMGILLAVLRFRRLMRNERFDAVVSMSYGPSIVALMAKKLGLDFKLVVSERQDPSRDLAAGWRKRLVRSLCGWMYRGSDLYHCNSPVAAERAPVLFKVSPKKTLFIPNGYDFSRLDEQSVAQPVTAISGPYVVSCGRLNEQKGQHIAIAVFARMTKLGYKGALVFIGDGSLRESLEACAEMSGVSDRVMFLGAVDNPLPYFRQADLVLVTSLWEGFANVPVEAVAVGGRVISTRWSGAKEVLQDAADFFSADLDALDRCDKAAVALASTEAMAAIAGLPRLAAAQSLREQYGYAGTSRRFVAAIEALQ